MVVEAGSKSGLSDLMSAEMGGSSTLIREVSGGVRREGRGGGASDLERRLRKRNRSYVVRLRRLMVCL